MSALSVQQVETGHWVGSAALSNMGFHVPTCSATTEVVPLVFVPCPELDELCNGRAYRIQSTQMGLDRADLWMNAQDVAIPSIIYRGQSPNNQLAYVFDMVPLGAESFALRSLADSGWVTVCGPRLVTQPTLTRAAELKFYSF
jgi:hypothetical protein